MEAPRYIDSEGRHLYYAEVNKHHVFWRKAGFRTPQEKKFRSMYGAIVPMTIAQHNRLHANVEPPIKPNPDLMRDIYRFARNVAENEPYDVFREMVDFIGQVAATSQIEQHVEEAYLLHENLVQQSAFIELGRVSLLRRVA